MNTATQSAIDNKDRLIESALRSLRLPHNHQRRWRGVVFWGLVAEVFGVGSTSACELCTKYGLDPHEKLA